MFAVKCVTTNLYWTGRGDGWTTDPALAKQEEHAGDLAVRAFLECPAPLPEWTLAEVPARETTPAVSA